MRAHELGRITGHSHGPRRSLSHVVHVTCLVSRVCAFLLRLGDQRSHRCMLRQLLHGDEMHCAHSSKLSSSRNYGQMSC